MLFKNYHPCLEREREREREEHQLLAFHTSTGTEPAAQVYALTRIKPTIFQYTRCHSTNLVNSMMLKGVGFLTTIYGNTYNVPSVIFPLTLAFSHALFGLINVFSPSSPSHTLFIISREFSLIYLDILRLPV